MKKFEQLKKWMILARESNVQNLLPWDSFLEKMGAAEELVDYIDPEEAEDNVIQQGRWHFVIMCVSAMETYFKGMAEIFVQGGWFKSSFLEILQQDRISLADLIEMNKEKFTLGEIISVSHNFQDLNSINNFYSKMIGCNNFVKEVGKYKALRGKGQYFVLNTEHPNFEEDINNLIHFRHLVIHHDISKRTLSAKSLDKMTGSLMDFMYATEFYLFDVSNGYTETK